MAKVLFEGSGESFGVRIIPSFPQLKKSTGSSFSPLRDEIGAQKGETMMVPGSSAIQGIRTQTDV